MKMQMDAKLWADGYIELETYCRNALTGEKEATLREVMNTKDEIVRQALIRLGWTPPPEPIDTTPPPGTQ